jgi:hypothetical protein
MCGRLLGRLLGTTRSTEDGNHSAGRPAAFLAYRPLDPIERIVRFSPDLRFRCRVCGGAGALDDVDVFSTYDEASDDELNNEDPLVRGRGRPARRFLPQRVTGIDAALGDL